MDPASLLTTYGPLGIIVILLITGQLVPGWLYRKLEKALAASEQARKLESERNDMLQQLALTGTKAMTALAEVAEEQRLETRQRRADHDVYSQLVRDQMHQPPGGGP